jgi:phosphate transport system substrate-binding protein
MHLRRRRQVTTAGLAVCAVALAACSSSSSSSSSSSASTGSSSTASASSNASLSGTLNGSGSTFQTVFQESAIAAFRSVDPGITVNYGSGGSGKGRTDLASGVVNYAGSDSPIPATDVPLFKGKTVLYFPVIIGPITMAYNLTGVSSLKLTPTVIANIFDGKITKWNDSAITSINPGVSLPSMPITVAVRSDSSGTTQNFTLFLKDAVPSVWTLGSSSTIKGLSFASVQNKTGAYIAPSPTSASAAADSATVATNLTFAAAWAPGATAYPITYQSWDLVYAMQPNANDAALLKAWIGYLISPSGGQSLLGNLGYAPLPSNLDSMAQAQLSQITS